MLFYAKLWPSHLNIVEEFKSHQTRKHFFDLLMSNFGEFVWTVASVSCSKLMGVATSVVFCCCYLLQGLCVVYSETLWSTLWLAFMPRELPLTGYFLFSHHFLQGLEMVILENPSSSFLNTKSNPSNTKVT